MTKNYPAFFASSIDPKSLALTWKGIAVAVIPSLIVVARMFGFDLMEKDLIEIVEQMTVILSSTMVLVGLFRKLAVALGIYK